MAGKILLINTNRLKPRVSPIGLDYLASSLMHSGAEIAFFDLAFEGRGWQERLKCLLKNFAPHLIGITVRNLDDCYFLSGQCFLKPIRTLILWLRQNTKAKIVLGGVGYSIAPKALIQHFGADYGIWGDGEEAIVKLLGVISKRQKPVPEQIQGLVIPGLNDFSRSETALDEIALNRNLANNSLYFQFGGQIGIETKRGCDGKCIYCADPLAKGKRLRMRSPESVADEIEELLSKGVFAFHICDSEFNRPYSHSVRVLEEICRRNLGKRIHLYSYCSPKPFDAELARLYARAGGKGICFGADSGSEEMLKTLRRDHSVSDLEKTLKFCHKYGLKVMYDLLLGGPGESRKSLSQTIRLMKKLKPDRVGISYGLRIYAGTELECIAEKQGILEKRTDNPELIFPVFYLSPELEKEGLEYLKNLVGTDPRFFLPAKAEKKQNYNYSGNLFLEKLIKKGARGAYWAILMEHRKDNN